ncbi:Very-long-chain (3R)-3-hydroxyacyl-CoA dehydratase 3 [Apodemus speciosus]|uniref:Very-long-chain (3R)-3-hydroxyacyl-CoA dehydratase n=1 Tax=Apodemus speciosus TaxID=105296 RepID=A0ABQ0F4Y9_APOSI
MGTCSEFRRQPKELVLSLYHVGPEDETQAFTNPAISITDNVLHFKAQGHGAKGDNVYEFHLEFLDLVKPEPAYRLTQRQVNITVQKKGSHWWERLTKQEKRPLFLAPDFDRWLDESDAEMELRAKEEERLNKLRLEREGSPETLTNLKKGYLFMYNLVQLLGFSWIFVNLTVRFFILGKESFYDTFHTVADMMYFCQMLALVETLNAAIGVTSSPVLPALIQSILPSRRGKHCMFLGRNFILFLVFGTMEEMQNKAVVFFVFYSWSAIEIFSSVAVIQSIPVFNESGRFSFTLPYPVKMKVRFSFFLQVYLVMLFLGLYINFRHLYKQRRRRYGQKKKKLH